MIKVGTIARRPGVLSGVCGAVLTVLRGLIIIAVGATVIGFSVSATVLVITGDLLESEGDRVLVALPSQPLKEYRSAGIEESREASSEDWVHSGPISFKLRSWPSLFRSWIFRLIAGGLLLSVVMWLWEMLDKRKPGRRREAGRADRAREPTGHIRVRSPLHR